MRIRATVAVAAVTGALALSALAVPAAQAAAGPNITFLKATVNNGKPIVARASGDTSVPVTYTFKHARGFDIGQDNLITLLGLYVGTFDPNKVRHAGDGPGRCTASSRTVAKCKGSIVLHTSDDDGSRLFNTDARKWNVVAAAFTEEDGPKFQERLGTTRIKFHSRLTTDVTPEPVQAGRTLTVKGALTRANWMTNKYDGLSNTPVTLQFKKKGTTTFTTVKTIRSGTAGALKTTVRASVDGTYRFAFAGTTATAPVVAVGDFVDVR